MSVCGCVCMRVCLYVGVSVCGCVSTGRGWEDKVAGVREKMKEKKAKGLVVTALDEIACMTNLCTVVAMVTVCIWYT